MKNEIFNYNGNDITFQIGNGDVMVSATAMAKAFPEKNLTNIINSVEIQEYIQEVAKLQNYTLADLVQVTTTTFTDSQGATRTSLLTVWTEAGRFMIHELFKQKETA